MHEKIVKLFKIDKIQFVWWWSYPWFKWWYYPLTYKEDEIFHGKPIFWGLYLGILEIRFFPIRRLAPVINEKEGNDANTRGI